MEALAEYASRIASVIDRVHEGMHRAAAPSFRATVTDRPPHTGLLITLRFVLLRGELVDESTFHLALRYQKPEVVSQAISDLIDFDFFVRQKALLAVTSRAKTFLETLYDVHAEAAPAHWGDVGPLASMTGRLLEAARATSGPAFDVMSPPFERPGDPNAVVLFNRLAALRYHRSDAHVAAWQAEGIGVEDIVALTEGEQRERIERETNRRAAPPFESLDPAERDHFLDTLSTLP